MHEANAVTVLCMAGAILFCLGGSMLGLLLAAIQYFRKVLRYAVLSGRSR